MSSENGISLPHHLMDPLCKEIPGLLPKAMHYWGLHIFVKPKSRPFDTFFGKSNPVKQANGFYLNKPYGPEEKLTFLTL
jgi:hypothetical protein